MQPEKKTKWAPVGAAGGCSERERESKKQVDDS